MAVLLRWVTYSNIAGLLLDQSFYSDYVLFLPAYINSIQFVYCHNYYLLNYSSLGRSKNRISCLESISKQISSCHFGRS